MGFELSRAPPSPSGSYRTIFDEVHHDFRDSVRSRRNPHVAGKRTPATVLRTVTVAIVNGTRLIALTVTAPDGLNSATDAASHRSCARPLYATAKLYATCSVAAPRGPMLPSGVPAVPHPASVITDAAAREDQDAGDPYAGSTPTGREHHATRRITAITPAARIETQQ
jgi:hypothetical protein